MPDAAPYTTAQPLQAPQPEPLSAEERAAIEQALLDLDALELFEDDDSGESPYTGRASI